jgi:hypothetical protein
MMTAIADQIPRRRASPPAILREPGLPRGEASMIATLARMAGQSGAPPSRLLGEFAGLSFGPGKLAFSDYARLRLYDEAFWAGVDKKSLVGARRAREIAETLNHGQDGGGLLANRLAANAYLEAFGFAVPATLAIFAHGVAAPGRALLRSRGELRQFLACDAPYPMFAAPMAGRSQAAGPLRGCDVGAGVLERLDGRLVALDDFIDEVSEHGRFIFQRLIAPEASVAALVGPCLAQVRVVTLAGEQGPRILRACWRLPPGEARGGRGEGELLAQLDLRSGAVLRVTRGFGPDLEEVTRHPQTGARLIGARVPGWDAVKATAIEAARALGPMAMIGWSIASSTAGPVILGLSATPDLVTHQLADRRGLLDLDFLAMMTARRHAAAREA